ncbi:MAG: M23 family metallopeptidase [Leptospirales bacterium]|nr:M23 family metallopeptidase [Leptospirales bacterium]
MADGKVVLADSTTKAANYFLIYMHLSVLNVNKGSMVKTDDLIGAAGSTAAHLHVSLILNWVELEPLGLLSLPVRD